MKNRQRTVRLALGLALLSLIGAVSMSVASDCLTAPNTRAVIIAGLATCGYSGDTCTKCVDASTGEVCATDSSRTICSSMFPGCI